MTISAEPTPASPPSGADLRLLNVLRRSGRIDAAAAAAVERSLADGGESLFDALAARGGPSDAEVASAIAEAMRIPLADLRARTPSEDAVGRIDEKTARRLLLVPIDVLDGVLVVAMANPLDQDARKQIEFATGLGLRPSVAPRDEILDAVRRWYKTDAALDALLAGVESPEAPQIVEPSDRAGAPIDVRAVAREAAQPPIIRLVNTLLLEAFNARASDIHFEPGPHAMLVRFRIDGILEDSVQIPRWAQAPIVARVKIMSKLDITERRVPQDGHFAVRFGEATVDVRVSSMPTHYGEKLVLRLLDPSRGLRRLGDIGLVERDLATLRRLIERPEGMILVTGPTGSGKTTTLYAIIQEIVSPEINIMTIENPIEYELPGVSQIPINEKQGLTFATVLRSVLRQDPDVIFVGEIRDRETAEIAFQAAQTGHLVLSTVHTNDTAATITRLFELGVEPHVMGPSLLGIVSQRLVRRVCPSCAGEVPVTTEERERLALPLERRIRAGRGCPACRTTGFSGRIGCYEVLEVTKAIEQRIAERAPETAIRSLAEELGMTSILDDARRKILDGVTTPAEVLRVVELDTKRRLSCPACHGTVEENFTVCPFCRAQLRRTCARCGVLLKGKWTACPFCGTPASPAEVAPAASPAAAGGGAEVTTPRILVVSDDLSVAQTLRAAWTTAEVDVAMESTSSIAEALRRAAAAAPHVAVVDQSAVAAGGDEVARLHALLDDGEIPIIALTERADAEATRRAFLSGAADCVARPFEGGELAARIEGLLQRRYGWSAARARPSAAPEPAAGGRS